METIAYPSPSALPNSPVLQRAPPGSQIRSDAKQKQPAKAKAQPPNSKNDGVTKPKQSKSRNGKLHLSSRLDDLSYEPSSDLNLNSALTRHPRVCDLQGKKAQVRRDEARLQTVYRQKGRVRWIQERLQMEASRGKTLCIRRDYTS